MGLSKNHKNKISKSLRKLSDSDIKYLRNNRDNFTVIELAKKLNVNRSSIYRALKKFNIKLSPKGKIRARHGSTMKQKGKIPWNKNQKLSEDTKKKISHAVSGSKNGQYGRGMTEKEKEKWRKSYQNSGIHKMRNWIKSPSGQKAQKKTIKTVKSEKYRTAASNNAAERIKAGTFKTFSWKQEWIKTKKCGKIFVKSSWEKMFAEKLDNNDNIETAQYEPIAIRYNYHGSKRNYYPDFLITTKSGKTVLCEIKPKKLLNYGKNKPKAAAGRKFCKKMGWYYQIITEDILFDNVVDFL